MSVECVESFYHNKLANIVKRTFANRYIKNNKPELMDLFEDMCVFGDTSVTDVDGRLYWLHESLVNFLAEYFAIDLDGLMAELNYFLRDNPKLILSEGISEDFDLADTTNRTVTDVVYFGELRLVRRLNEIRPRVYELKACADRRLAATLDVDDPKSGWCLMDIDEVYEHPFVKGVSRRYGLDEITVLAALRHLGMEKFKGWRYVRVDDSLMDEGFVEGLYMPTLSKGHKKKNGEIDQKKVIKKLSAAAGVFGFLIRRRLIQAFMDKPVKDDQYEFEGRDISRNIDKGIEDFTETLEKQTSKAHLKEYRYFAALTHNAYAFSMGNSVNRKKLYLGTVIQDNLKELDFWRKESDAKALYYLLNSYRTSENPFKTPNKTLFADDYFAYPKLISNKKDFYEEFLFPDKASQRRMFQLKPIIMQIMVLNSADNGLVFHDDLKENLKLAKNFWRLTMLWLSETDRFPQINTYLIWCMKTYFGDLFIKLPKNESINAQIPVIYDLLYSYMENYWGDTEGAYVRDCYVESDCNPIKDFLQANVIKMNEDKLYVKTSVKNAMLIKKSTTVKKLERMVSEWHELNTKYQDQIATNKEYDEDFDKPLDFWRPINLELEGHQITSLNSLKELLQEANIMSHCLYTSYKDYFEKGEYAAFRIANIESGERATLGVGIADGKVFYHQCYSVYNNLPSDELVAAAKAFINQLNEEEIPFLLEEC